MDFIFYLFIFLFGLIVGSFLNVVIYRLETGETVVSGRSHCRDCGHVLEWYDLVPILSFLMLGGKCRYCKNKISWQYPIVEIITALLFLLIFNFQFSIFNEFSISDFQFLSSAPDFNFFYFLLSTFYFLFIISSLIVIFAYDLKHYIIPDKIVYSAIGISIIYLLFKTLDFGHWNLFGIWDLGFGISNPLSSGLFAAILTGGFFFAIVVITKGAGMGGGDVKLAFLMGLVLGWPNILPALFLAFATGAIYGIILIIIKKKTFKSEVPFGPFLVMGTLAAMFYGENMVKWYMNYLF